MIYVATTSLLPTLSPTSPPTNQFTSSTISSFLTTLPTQFPGVTAPSLDWVSYTSLFLSGGSILPANIPPTGVCVLANATSTVTTRNLLVYLQQSSTLKMMVVRLTISGINIYAQIVQNRYVFPGFICYL